MPLMKWDRKYSVGVIAMDTQHQKWFGIINELHEAMLAGRAREMQHAILAEMVAYTHTHFTHEEALLKMKGYPKLPEHQQKHAAFTTQVQELQAKLKAGVSVLTLEVMDSLKQWLNSHILSEDVKYGAWIQANRT